MYSHIGIGYALLLLALYIIVGLIISFVVAYLVKFIGRLPPLLIIAVIFTILVIFYYYKLGKTYGWTLIAILMLFPSFFVGGLYALHNNKSEKKRRYLQITVSVIGILGIFTSAYLLLYPGKDIQAPINAKSLSNAPEPIEALDPSLPGTAEVAYLCYGSGKDKYRDIYGAGTTIKTPSVDASFLLKSWKGFTGKLRTKYFGFDQTALPLNAQVWYPKHAEAASPLVLIVHGNHLAQDYSDGGYDYLGELLASKGYVVASVDENFLNGSFTDLYKGGLEKENGTRGWLLLKHLELWRKWNDDPSSNFYKKIDMERIALIGHSRGGEAVGHAAFFNTLPCFPDHAQERFNFNFNIQSVIAIAPVDGQYKPASILTPLKDINYFVIHGSHDMDMQSYGGLSTYNRIKFSNGFEGFKAGLYIHRANHGQFNTSWGRRDNWSPSINQFNLKQLMSAEQQQQIAKVYISSFLETTLRDQLVYKPLFMDYRFARQWLPNEIYLNQFEDSKTFLIADYEEDLDLQSATIGDSVISSNHLSVWHEQQQELMWGNALSRAAYIGWDWSAVDTLVGSYTFNLPDSLPKDIANTLLTFTLATSEEDAAHQEKGKKKENTAKDNQNRTKEDEENIKKKDKDSEEKPIDFSIELVDQNDEKIRFLLSECSALQPQIKKKITKFAFLNQWSDAEAISDFFYFDLQNLQRANPTFSFNHLKKISFIFDQINKGVIILDNVGFIEK
ncbi:hypothetical protein H8S90_21760 [Olivibacter sp. SDN3]|uniref:hypothetical protein n=1 Tax=Olivibacter sp. SDN3 TaxID=2764720 RepID=UPI00165183C0|nr:hypothetical protein [Olivibacter sp. SDN3]QNL49329.1 hypothetical protein H8S90_21760 [Olivibacter sp. SDN3]